MTTKVEVTLDDDNGSLAPLFCQYPQQHEPQRAYLQIDPEDAKAWFGYSGDVGNGVPMRVWHDVDLRLDVNACVSRAALEAFIEDQEAQKLLARIVDGHVVEWDGSNHVGRMGTDASAAMEALEAALMGLETVDVWRAGEWIEEGFSLGELVEKGIEVYAAEAGAPPSGDVAIIGSLDAAIAALAVELVRRHITCETEGDATVLAAAKLLVRADAGNQGLLDDYIAEFGEEPATQAHQE